MKTPSPLTKSQTNEYTLEIINILSQDDVTEDDFQQGTEIALETPNGPTLPIETMDELNIKGPEMVAKLIRFLLQNGYPTENVERMLSEENTIVIGPALFGDILEEINTSPKEKDLIKSVVINKKTGVLMLQSKLKRDENQFLITVLSPKNLVLENYMFLMWEVLSEINDNAVLNYPFTVEFFEKSGISKLLLYFQTWIKKVIRESH